MLLRACIIHMLLRACIKDNRFNSSFLEIDGLYNKEGLYYSLRNNGYVIEGLYIIHICGLYKYTYVNNNNCIQTVS